jgi:hypothetical protein
MMLILLLPATFISLFLTINGYHTRQQTLRADWRTAFLQSATLMGGYMVMFSELLSLFHALTTVWVAFFWALALVTTLIFGWRKGWLSEGFLALENGWNRPGWFDILAGTILTVILVILFFIAIKSPVNNNDSLQYHMARVMHWAQDKSLAHYATNFVPQLVHPLWAELAILNYRLLSGGDQFASLIQWLSMVGAIIGATAIASLLGAKKIWQWVTIAFAISLPTGILESTSTQNDYVVAFWLVCLLYFIFRNSQIDNKVIDIAMIGLALGLGMLTKGTFFPYAAGAMFYLIYSVISKNGIIKSIAALLIIGFFAVLLNLGNWSRNVITFGTPLGPKTFVSKFTAQSFGPIQILSGVSRNLAQNFSTPEDTLNNQIVTGLKGALGQFDPAMESFGIEWGWNHEDLAGNPLHVLLIVASLFILILMKKRVRNPILWIYMVIILSMYPLFAAIVKYDLYGNRYQLPFFIAWAPLFGIAVGMIGKVKLSYLTTILLLLSAFPWVLFNRTRPLIAMRNSNDPYTIPCLAGCTTGSILNESPEKTMFAVWGTLGNAYVDAMNQVKQTGCKEIGLKLDSNDLEYAYWYLLGAPQNGMRLETIVTYPELERYLDISFKPCVIICTTCGEQDSLFGLNRIGSFANGRIKIYSGENYTHP